MSFYGKYFRGLLDTQRKKFAAYSTSHEKFSMPTLIGRNKHVLLYNDPSVAGGNTDLFSRLGFTWGMNTLWRF